MTISLSIRRFSIVLTLFLTLILSDLFGQISSENGWVLPTEGKIRVLAVFVEIDFGGDKEADLFPNGTDEWPVGELPQFKDDLFNVEEGDGDLRTMTAYYKEISLENFTLLGDYYPELITLDHDEIGNNKTKILRAVTQHLSDADVISSSGLKIEDFDFWKNSSGNGEVKEPSMSFDGIDHLMIMLRNFKPIPNGMGQASSGSAGDVKGKKTDSYSIFGAGDGLPFKMFRHEFNHLLIGGNNFHAGGGNAVTFRSYHYFVQAGWSMMGAANSSFLTCSGWDRYWLGWKPQDGTGVIQALNESGESVNSDLQKDSKGGIFILRDFLTTGDVLRIELPHIPEGEFPQWIWVENHTTRAFNGSDFDVFQYEHADCITDSKPGLYLQRQIDANEKLGDRIYMEVNADYLKPLPAEGCFDFSWDKEVTDLKSCISAEDFRAYELLHEKENPLTGNHTLEFPIIYSQGDEKADVKKTPVPGLRRKNGDYIRLPYLGHPDNGFREGYKERIGIGTNPSTASVLTNLNRKTKRSEDKRNSDAVYLNGISLEILETFPDGSIKVKVVFDDNLIDDFRRWCAPEIILSNHNISDKDLVIKGKLVLDRGETLTRYSEPDTIDGKTYFTLPTVLRIKKGATCYIEGELHLQKDSRIVCEDGAQLLLAKGGRIILGDQSSVVLRSGALIDGKGRIKIKDGGMVFAEEESLEKAAKGFTCKKRSVRIMP